MSVSDMPQDRIVLDLAEAWSLAVKNADRGRIERLFTDDAIIWRNVNRLVQPRAEFIDLAIALSGLLPGFRYEDITRFAFPGGFVQQHVITGLGPSGQPFEAPACIVCQVRDGQISRLDEYYDSAHDPR
jgi:hypothetical protein